MNIIPFLKAVLKKNAPVILLTLIIILIGFLNYKPSLFLIGWDNFLSELNILLNLKRSIVSVWLNYAGLGLLDGMGHASELPHIILKWLISLIFPISAVRQIYVFLMLGTGVLGLYFLIKKLIRYENSLLNWVVPVSGALFYLLNLGMVQNFYVPFEPFAVHYAFFPWLFLSAIYFIENRTFKSLFFFFIVNLLAIPQAQVPTVFVVYIFSLFFFISVLVIETKSKEILISGIKVLLFTLLINAFWLLPFIYFVANNSEVAFLAKINQMSTQTVFQQNKEFGNLSDVVLIKGFWFNNVDPNFQGKFDYMLKPWIEHLTPFISITGYFLFGIVLLGISQLKTRKSFVLPVFGLFLFAFTMLAVNTPPFSWIDNVLREIPLFKQVFRFPFTKFSILAAFTYSFFFALGIGKITEYASKKLEPRKVSFLFIPILLLMVIFVFPIFKGHLFYGKERVNFPSEYNQLFKYFSSKPPTARVANFPQHTLWGWNYYRWGYGGSGFLWYGMPQPIMDRAFDVWSKYDENYYWEISYALYSKNIFLFEKVLQKYNIEYLIVDKNVISAYSQDSLFIPQLEAMLDRLPGIKKEANFGRIDIYRISNIPTYVKTVRATVNGYNFGDFDRAYFELGDYVTLDSQKADIVYPFRSLFSGKNEEDKEFKIEIKNGLITFVSGKDKLDINKEEVDYYAESEVKNCDNFRKGEYSSEIKERKLRLYSKNAVACTSVELNVSPSQGYLLTIENKNIAGRGIHMWISNKNSSNPLIDTYLSENKKWTTSYFVIPPQDEFSTIYSLHLDNVSIQDESTNELGKISLYPIPYDALSSYSRVQKVSTPLKVLALNQAYDKGWKTYEISNKNSQIEGFFPFIFGKELKSHVLLNNWSNGWVLDEKQLSSSNRFVTIYLPQYLEYLGFLILAGFVIYTLYSSYKESRKEQN